MSDVKIAKPWSASLHRHPVLLLYTQSPLYNYTPQPGQRQPRVIWAKLFNLEPRPEPEPFHILQLSQNTPSTSSRALHYNCDNSVLLSWCFHTTSRCLLQGRCNREKPACKYFHPPQHLKVSLAHHWGGHTGIYKHFYWEILISGPVTNKWSESPGTEERFSSTNAAADDTRPGAYSGELNFFISHLSSLTCWEEGSHAYSDSTNKYANAENSYNNQETPDFP